MSIYYICPVFKLIVMKKKEEEKEWVRWIEEEIQLKKYELHGIFDLEGIHLGNVDAIWQLSPNKWIFFEYESGQNHPDTNVLKVWPYLIAHPLEKILLIQLFDKKPEDRSSRDYLCEFIGNRIQNEKVHKSNFRYYRCFTQSSEFRKELKQVVGDFKQI